MTVRLAIPSKGRLLDQTFEWFAAQGMQLERARSERRYAVTLAGAGAGGIDVVLLAASEIPRELLAGRIHFGITGSDLAREGIAHWEEHVEALARLGFGHADLMIAVPQIWVDVLTLDDLDGAAAAFRKTHGFRMRISTKYHRLVREFLQGEGIADYALVDSQGATEGAVKNETAEAIADISSTGSTLQANRLRPLEGGLIHRSEATLFRSRHAEWTDSETEIGRAFLDKLSIQ